MMSMSMTPREGHLVPTSRASAKYGFDDDYLIMLIVMIIGTSAVTDFLAVQYSSTRVHRTPQRDP